MTAYVYETIPQKPGQKPRYFEFKQSMSDAPLTKHPKTGEPIRRIVLGGYGVLKSTSSAPKNSGAEGGCCCGPSGCSD